MARDLYASNGSSSDKLNSKSHEKTVIHITCDGESRERESSRDNQKGINSTVTTPESTSNEKIYIYQALDHVVEIYSKNLKCLSPETYLDDSIMRFFTAHLLKDICQAQTTKTIHVFDNYFHNRLCETFKPKKVQQEKNSNDNKEKHEKRDVDAQVNRDKWRALNKWFNGVNIFEKNFLIFPICQEEHWLAIIVCYPGEVNYLESDELTTSPDTNLETEQARPEPGIIVMDSLGLSNRLITKEIREFLDFEWRTRLTTIKNFSYHSLPQYHPKLPTQKNAYDCGIYTLAYLRAFALSPEKFYRCMRENSPTSDEPKKRLPEKWLEFIHKQLETCSRENLKNLVLKSCQVRN